MPGPQRLPLYGFRGRQGVVSRRLQHPFSQPIGPRRRLRIHGEHCGLQQDQGPHPVEKAACELQGYLAAGAPADDSPFCLSKQAASGLVEASSAGNLTDMYT